jgi:lipoyl(octanoyl) transferase
MNGGGATDDHSVPDSAVPTKHRSCCDLDVVAEHAVVPNMTVGHEVVVVADAGRLCRLASMDRDAFTKHVPVADDQTRLFTGVIEVDVLRSAADDRSRPEGVFLADISSAGDVVLGHQSAACTDSNGAGHDAPGPDDDIVGQLDVTFDDGGGVDGWHVCCWGRVEVEEAGRIIRDSKGTVTLPHSTPNALEITDLGRMAYEDALSVQRQRLAEVVADRGTGGLIGHLLLVEHDPPVITVSRRPGARDHLLADSQRLAAAGVIVADTDRGGDITYHGPGQLVVYPILDLNRLDLRLHGYLRWLEDRVLETLSSFGIKGHRDECATGVWVGGAPDADGIAVNRKICAMGVRVSRWVSMHGLAINIHTDLSHFDLIVPCGLAGREVTSMHRELGEHCPSMQEVKDQLVQRFLAAVV